MKLPLRLAIPACLCPALALAIYAPIPEEEQGKALSYRLGASVYHDSNIFGGATNEIDSMVYTVSGRIAYNGSVTDQTFVSASYEVSLDHIADRPGKQNLTSHNLMARLAHAFSQTTNIDLTEIYTISKNPASLLAGVPLNTDQSFKRNEFNGRFATALGQKTGAVVKYRNAVMAYDVASLAAQLDRMEQIFGLEANFALLPETKLIGEYRYQDIAYDVAGFAKDKQSHFLLGGVDYSPSQQILASVRVGFEDRSREGASDTTAPYAELSGRYGYAEGSFVAAGYTYTIEEPSDPVSFTDTQVNRFFVNVQHRLTGAMTASGSLTFEPSQLQGRSVPDVDEDIVRFGLGLTWVPRPNWTMTATYDLDRVYSGLAFRDQERDRLGVSARFSF